MKLEPDTIIPQIGMLKKEENIAVYCWRHLFLSKAKREKYCDEK